MKTRIVAAFLLAALAGWLVPPAKTAASNVSTSTQTLPQIYDEIRERNTPTDSSKSHSKSQAKEKEVTKQTNVPNRPTSNNGVYNGRHYSKEEVQQLIKDYSAQYGINPEVPLCIAQWESGYNQLARNKSSSAAGVFQYLASTWRGTDEGKAGYSVFDAEANVKAAIKYMAIHRNVRPWVVAPRCPPLKFL